jgi:hypothetical protein
MTAFPRVYRAGNRSNQVMGVKQAKKAMFTYLRPPKPTYGSLAYVLY